MYVDLGAEFIRQRCGARLHHRTIVAGAGSCYWLPGLFSNAPGDDRLMRWKSPLCPGATRSGRAAKI